MKRIVWMLVIAAAIVTLATFWSTCQAQVVLRAVVKPTAAAETTSVSDDFNRASIGTNWTQRWSDWAISGDTAAYNTTGASEAMMYWAVNPTSFQTNQYSVVFLGRYATQATPSIGPAVRCSAGSDTSYYLIYTTSDGTWYAGRFIHQTWTEFANGDLGTVANGDSLKLIAKADSIIAWYNTTRLGGWEYTGADKLSSGRVGIAGYANGAVINANAWRGGKWTE